MGGENMMKHNGIQKITFLCLGLFLVACPTPPEQVNTQTNNGQNQPNPQGNNGNNGNNSPQGQNGQQNQPNPQGQNTENPPEQKTNDGVPPENGNTVDGSLATEGSAPVPNDAVPTPVTDSLLIRVERISSLGAKPLHTQEELANQKTVTFSGTIVCDDCTDNLVLRAMYFIGPNDNHSENNLITHTPVTIGDFSILIPKSDKAVAMELLVDKNKDGLPSAGEYFAVIEQGGQLIPNMNRASLTINATEREFFTPAPSPGTVAPQ